MAVFTRVSSRVIPLPADDVDTDQIIPARFLKVTSKEGLGEKLFSDWRYLADGKACPKFPLNKPENQGAQILLAGRNFGCGSSREHAPWALTDFGIRVVIALSFADIFKGNALKNGLLPVAVEPRLHARLTEERAKDANYELTVDLLERQLILPDNTRAEFPIDPFSRKCLLEGIDELGYLLKLSKEIEVYERRPEN